MQTSSKLSNYINVFNIPNDISPKIRSCMTQ